MQIDIIKLAEIIGACVSGAFGIEGIHLISQIPDTEKIGMDLEQEFSDVIEVEKSVQFPVVFAGIIEIEEKLAVLVLVIGTLVKHPVKFFGQIIAV